jgi:hypothetical protein
MTTESPAGCTICGVVETLWGGVSWRKRITAGVTLSVVPGPQSLPLSLLPFCNEVSPVPATMGPESTEPRTLD